MCADNCYNSSHCRYSGYSKRFSKLLIKSQTSMVSSKSRPSVIATVSFATIIIGFACHNAGTQPESSSLAIYCIYFYSFIPVAATGIPHPQAKHAEIMARFAIGILKKMDHLSKKLELMFGPDTGELKLRKYIRFILIHRKPNETSRNLIN